MSRKVQALPDVPEGLDESLTEFLLAVKQRLEMREGDTKDTGERFVTEQQLIAAGVVSAGDIT